MSLGLSSKKQTTNQTGQSDPYEPTIPYLNDFLTQLGGVSTSTNPGATPAQADAFKTLETTAQAGNPYAGDISSLTKDMFNSTSYAPQVSDAYSTLKNQIGGYANGDYLDFSKNPYVQKMLSTVGDDVSNRIKATFAGAGRDVTGNAAGLEAVGKGVTEAQLPILSQLYQTQQQNQLGAAKSLYDAGSGSATTQQQLDAAALAARSAGVDASGKAIEAENYAPNTTLNLEQQLKSLPFEDLSLYASLLYPLAQLGQQTQGTAVGKSTGTTFGLSL